MPTQNGMTDDSTASLGEVLSRARKYLASEDLENAVRICHEMLNDFPDHRDAMMLRAEIEARQGRFLAAAKTVDRILALNPEDGDALRNRAQIENLRIQASQHPYAQSFLKSRSLHLDYPRTISIETVGRCNAKCNFCPAPELERRNEAMSDELFSKVIGDIQEIPPGVPININTNLINEPFMDKKMFARLRHINEALPTARIQMYSNFNVMPRNYLAKFRQVQNLGSLNISFNAANKVDYEAVMHVDFERTVRHLKAFMSDNRQDRFLHKPIILSRVADNTQGDHDYLEQCRSLFSEFEEGIDYRLYVKKRVTWVGDTHVEQSQVPYFLPCDAWLDINIMCTGVVPLCCLDAKGDQAIGDVTRNSVLEIYNSPGFRNLRENHLQRESLPVCGGCSPYAAVREDPKHLNFRKIDVPVELLRDASQ
jgi:hypothetical protein